MFESLKADGAVVEKVFDGKGSMIVRSTDKAALAELAASLAATDAQESTAAGQVGEVMTDRYAKARGKWRPAANPAQDGGEEDEDGGEEAALSEASSRKTVRQHSLTPQDLVGMRVSIGNVTALPTLEGQTGSVMETSSEPGRVLVLLDGSSQKVNIPVKHLQLLGDGANGTECSSSDVASHAVNAIAAVSHRQARRRFPPCAQRTHGCDGR